MDREFQERIRKLERLLAEDEICRVYRDSARELDAALGDLMRRLPREDREILGPERMHHPPAPARADSDLRDHALCGNLKRIRPAPKGAGRCCISGNHPARQRPSLPPGGSSQGIGSSEPIP